MNFRLPFLTLLLLTAAARAQLTIPSDGSDGAFNPAANLEVDLSQAVTGTWSDPSSASGKGIYDPNKWAIVFKYSSVNIPADVTVTFRNHPSNPPVVWLVQGAVNIAGTVSVNGKPGVSGTQAIYPVDGGPGGFRGGVSGAPGYGTGLGIGGAAGGDYHGGYSEIYGNPQILPLIGGSGGYGWDSLRSGSGGGGAILIASANNIQLGGTISARGGNSVVRAGSGGAIKLICNSVAGSGNLDASSPAYAGRIRVEANSLSPTITVNPSTIAVPPGITPVIFQADNAPTVKILSVDGLPSPAEPTAPLITSADIGIEKNTPVTITLETRNFPTAGAVVSVRRAVKFGGYEWQNATFVSGNNALATWQVSMTFTPGFNTLQARATAP